MTVVKDRQSSILPGVIPVDPPASASAAASASAGAGGEEKKSGDEPPRDSDDDLPASYREALSSLLSPASSSSTAAAPPLQSLSDSDVLSLCRELLDNLYSTKDEWAAASDWTTREAELLRVGGRAADAAAAQSRLNVGSLAGEYVSTYAEALEYKIARSSENTTAEAEAKVPELLRKTREVGESKAYGPVSLGARLPGNEFEVWATPGRKSAAAVADGSAPVESDAAGSAGEGEGKVEVKGKEGRMITVVLGAGNQSSLSLTDALHCVFRLRSPVLIKHHPLRPWLDGPYAVLLSPLIDKGYVAQVRDVGVPATTALLSRPEVGHVHITGSLATADAVRATLRRARPSLSPAEIGSMVTSELGCATPMIFDAGRYTEAELRHAAQIIVFGKKANGGCNCLSAQVVVLPQSWEQKDALRAKLKEELRRQPTAPCYYPGSRERKEMMEGACRERGSRCELIAAPAVSEETKVDDKDQVTLVECGVVGKEGFDPIPLEREAFGSILAVVELPHDKKDQADGDDYLSEVAVPWLNDKSNIFGSLSCSIFTPASKSGNGKLDDLRKRLEPAVAALQYGGIAVNNWNAVPYFTLVRGGMWGGHPSERLGQSGTGRIGDQFSIPGIEKAVVYGPPLENKPLFDMANVPPPIVFDVMRELQCSGSATTAAARVVKMLVVRSARYALGWVPGMSLLLGE